MPQELRILQCIQCETFQVDIVKKTNKWTCKVCNAKQNLRKVLFHGTGADCRKKVQQLNQEKAFHNENRSDAILKSLEYDDDMDENFLLEAATQIDNNLGTSKYVRPDEMTENSYAKGEETFFQKRKLPMDENEMQKTSKTSKWDAFL